MVAALNIYSTRRTLLILGIMGHLCGVFICRADD